MPVDDPSIDGAVRLYRRVHPDFIYDDEARGCRRLATGTFQHEEMSVALGDTLESLGQEPSSLIDDYEGYSLVSFTVDVAHEAELGVCRDPKPDEPAHGLVLGKKTGAKKRKLAGACTWTVAPNGACEPPY